MMKQLSNGRLPLIVLTVFLLGGCASNPATMTDPENDPWEDMNRKVFGFNMAVDKAILKPVAKGYDTITPRPLKKGIGNALRNLGYPVVIVNLALQGKLKESAIGTGRFLFNSTVGVLGLFDVASKAGMPDYDEDFGQTLAAWGYDDSRYIMLPFFGPATVRDGIGKIGNSQVSGEAWFIREHDQYIPAVLGVIDLRARLLPQDATYLEAPDPYALIRDAYLQQREYVIYDGDPPLPEYDDYLDEDFP
jgi:phospholipid-binding lipoprotein MlaA